MGERPNPDSIDMDDFIDLLVGQVDEGDNGLFCIDEQGIRANVPTVNSYERNNLFCEERRALRQFERECKLDFPCTIEDVRAWIERTGEADMTNAVEVLTQSRRSPVTGKAPAAVTSSIPAPGKPGHPVTNDEAINEVIQIYQRQQKKNMARACREVVAIRFPNHPDPKRKAESLASGIRQRRLNQGKA
ncbi:hypothetical protein [uncultured Thiohalocapsa sp.]|uniref:hypothetical protein n=1 Tax=uncultured Thiohalocapsa sp. TaxID=768990 RepID=UPI0025F3C6EC|nr:hypothetical protein [uncultured Thiohalocapsa sp.]